MGHRDSILQEAVIQTLNTIASPVEMIETDFKQVNKVVRFFALALALVSATVVMTLSSQAANAQYPPLYPGGPSINPNTNLIVSKAKLLFGVDLPLGRESPTFIQNVTQLAKEGFDSPENAKLFIQLDSIALNATKAHPGNITLTAPTISHIISVYDQMKKKFHRWFYQNTDRSYAGFKSSIRF